MGFVAGLFLTYMEHDDAFYCFLSLLQNPLTNLRELYLPAMAEGAPFHSLFVRDITAALRVYLYFMVLFDAAQKKLYVFEALGRQHLGALWVYLEEQGLHPSMYATEWLMTLFCRGFPFDLVTRVWDIFIHESDYKIIYRMSLTLLKNREDELMNANFEGIMAILKTIPMMIDASALIEVTVLVFKLAGCSAVLVWVYACMYALVGSKVRRPSWLRLCVSCHGCDACVSP
jgi:hypothetical protein